MHALGTDIRIEGEGAAAAAREIRRLEGLLTRFRPSALTRLNRDGHLEHPPHELVGALQHALEVAERSGGLVTPTMLPSLEHAGYLRSWPQTMPPRYAAA